MTGPKDIIIAALVAALVALGIAHVFKTQKVKTLKSKIETSVQCISAATFAAAIANALEFIFVFFAKLISLLFSKNTGWLNQPPR